MANRYPSISDLLPRASTVPECGVSGALILSSCDFTFAIASVVKDGVQFMPTSEFGGWGGTVNAWWDYLLAEPGSSMAKNRHFFSLP